MEGLDLIALAPALIEVVQFELQRRLIEIVRSDPTVSREIATVEGLLLAGQFDELPPDWCRRLNLPIHTANREKVIVVRKQISGPDGERLIELDRVVFNQQLREGADGGDVWLEIALVHPADLPNHYRFWISTRFSLADRKVSATVVKIQRRWSERFGAQIFNPDEIHPYIYSPRNEKVTRTYGAQNRFEIASDVAGVYQYLDVIAHSWDWHGSNPQTSPRTVRQSILDDAPQSARDLFAAASKKTASGSQDKRPKLNIELVERVGQALGYMSVSGVRRIRGKARPTAGEIDQRLLPLVAKILAQKHRKPAARLLRTVVRPKLLEDAFNGLTFESAERVVRPNKSTNHQARRGKKPGDGRSGDPIRKKD